MYTDGPIGARVVRPPHPPFPPSTARLRGWSMVVSYLHPLQNLVNSVERRRAADDHFTWCGVRRHALTDRGGEPGGRDGARRSRSPSHNAGEARESCGGPGYPPNHSHDLTCGGRRPASPLLCPSCIHGHRRAWRREADRVDGRNRNLGFYTPLSMRAKVQPARRHSRSSCRRAAVQQRRRLFSGGCHLGMS